VTRRKRKKKADARDESTPADDAALSSDGSDATDVTAGGWQDKKRKILWRNFPVAGLTDEPLRVAFSRKAYADLTAHTKENLDEEVCGVLAGDLCEDEQGEYVSVIAVVAGTSTKRGAAHVTYTQETWTRIHETMAYEHPKLGIVGWYHSHPGFGVEFSDTDLFIQENFFSGSLQIAVVVDPIGGEEAICFKSGSGVEYVRRFWVEQRERKCHVPAGADAGASTDDAGRSGDRNDVMWMVHERLRQNAQAIEELRITHYRFLLTLGAMVAIALMFWIGAGVYSRWTRSARPPDVKAFVPTPVKIGDRWRWIRSTIVTEPLDPEIEARLIELEQAMLLQAIQQRLEEQEAQAEAGEEEDTE